MFLQKIRLLFGEEGESTAPPPATEENGDNAPATGETEPVDKAAKFKELIDGEYKEEFQKHFQKTFDRRFKSAKANEEYIAEATPLIDFLKARYGVSDIKSIRGAIDSDEGFWTSGADKANKTNEEYKEDLANSMEVDRIRQENEKFREREEINRKVSAWKTEEQNVRAEFPDFSLDEAVKDERFLSLLDTFTRNGYPDPVKTAYVSCNYAGIMANAQRSAAQSAAKGVRDTIASGAGRPTEIGAMSSSPSAKLGKDVNNLTNDEIDEAIRRARNGEKVTFA